MNNYVKIFDTTLRDGEQAPGFSMNIDEKVRLALQLEKLGVDVIEAGFPAASPDDFAAVQKIAQACTKPEICGLSRAMTSDIQATWDAIKDAQRPRIHTFIATSPIHMEHKLKKSPEQIIEMAVKAVKFAKSLCDRVDFSPEDAGRSDRNFLVKIIDAAIDAGADTINIPDTVGYLSPTEFGDLIAYLIANVKKSDQVIFATHCHNDLGLAVANSLAGVQNGARQVECTINGIGERAGNAALEEVVMALQTRPYLYNSKTGIDTTQIARTSQLLQQITGQKVQANKAITGRNAFAHESGIHQDGILKNPETYEIMTPESVGLTKTEIILGKHSGRAALYDRLQKLGYEVKEDQASEIFENFKKLADQKKDIADADLDILMMPFGYSHRKNLQANWELKHYSVASGSETVSTATIEIYNTKEQKNYKSTKTGTGMVDAAYQCLEEICGVHGTLNHFNMDAVTNGLDAQAIVSVGLIDAENQSHTARTGDTDIVKAAILSYLQIINNCQKQ